VLQLKHVQIDLIFEMEADKRLKAISDGAEAESE
jgi:hypothetical protein